MIKNFFIIIFVLLLAASSYTYWRFSSNKTLITPYPYIFTNKVKISLEKEIVEAENAKILIMGDQMGEVLSNYTPGIIDDLAKSFKNPPRIYNWSRAHEGLHRTLYKLKSMKKLPSIIVYHGASSELYEKFFDVNDKDTLYKNFSLYDNEKIISLIITFPWLSKIIYKNIHYLELENIKEYHNQLDGHFKLLEKEISFKLFNYELTEIINLVKDKKSHLIFITTPINLEIPPVETCSHSTTNEVIELQQVIEQLLKDGNFKLAYPKALELSNETFSNAQSFYLLGQASMGLGDLAMARESFKKAAIFDCANWRGNSVYNSLLKAQAKKHHMTLIDFDQYISSALSKDALFIDNLFPQNIFYKTMIEELKDNLKKILSVD